MRNVLDESYRENQNTNIMCNNFLPPPPHPHQQKTNNKNTKKKKKKKHL